MTEPPEPPPAEVGRPGSFIFGCVLGLLALVGVGSIVVWRGKVAEDRKRDVTLQNLEALASLVRQSARTAGAAPRADGLGADWSGLGALGAVRSSTDDGWGHRLHYRCPGVVHKKGWDVYSCGPNGKDDQGTFDDLLVGEDVAPVTSR